MFVAEFEGEFIKGLFGPFDSREEANDYCMTLGDGSWVVSPLHHPE